MGKIEEIIKRAKSEVLINAPDLSVFDGMYDEMMKAKERGVKIKIAAEKRGDLAKYQKVASVRTRDKIHGIDIVADEREILIAPPLPIAAAWVDNPEMALHVKDFLELVWKDARILS
jgi:sugar-specific transcriptional regulator TrmB